MNKKNILITGITRGLGKHLTTEFLNMGHTVAGCGRSTTALSEFAAEYRNDALKVATVDLAEDASVEAWANTLSKEHFIPDLIINNAAIMNSQRPLWEIPEKEFSELIDINIKGCFAIIRHFMPAMLSQQKGVIVNISSGWGRSTAPMVAPYCTSKWAIEGMSSALAQELPEGMTSVSLNPGIIDTDMLRSCWGESAGAYPSPEYWAKTAATFILSIDPTHNGQALSVP